VTIFAVLRVSGVVYVDKFIIGPIYYWAYFPHYLNSMPLYEKLVIGMPVLFLEQLLVAVALWLFSDLVFDLMGIDIVGVARLKEKIARNRQVRRHNYPRMYAFLDSHKTATRRVEYVVFSWQFIAILALLCMRVEGTRGKRSKEFAMLVGSCAISTVYWTLYSCWLYKPLAAGLATVLVFLKAHW
jgi:hypothetical protein